MSFLLWKSSSKTKSPHELTKTIKECINRIDQTCKKCLSPEFTSNSTSILIPSNFPISLPQEDKKMFDKANDEISKNLSVLKGMLCGEQGNESTPDMVAQVAHEFYAFDIVLLLVQHMYILEFETRKDVGQIFSQLLRRQIGDRYPTVEYFQTKDSILAYLILGYEHQETALICGLMLRECIKHEILAQVALTKPFTILSIYENMLPENHAVSDNLQTIRIVMKLFDFIETPTFDIASDAFATLKELLTRHKSMVAKFLMDEYDQFFAKFNSLLQSSNYVTRRQSLKLLGELLLDRSNYDIMSKYISYTDNLKLMMNLLRDKSKNIQYEAFHVFKIFVANPNRPKPIQDILCRNKDRLITFLGTFQSDRSDDQFSEERAYLIKQITALESTPTTLEHQCSDDLNVL